MRSFCFCFWLMLAFASFGCASTPPPRQFVLADPSRYRTEEERSLARQSAESDCKAKAIAASAAVHKVLTSEKHENLGGVLRARDKENEMYAATFTSCMNKSGFLLR
jgi:hypothetical protein